MTAVDDRDVTTKATLKYEINITDAAAITINGAPYDVETTNPGMLHNALLELAMPHRGEYTLIVAITDNREWCKGHYDYVILPVGSGSAGWRERDRSGVREDITQFVAFHDDLTDLTVVDDDVSEPDPEPSPEATTAGMDTPTVPEPVDDQTATSPGSIPEGSLATQAPAHDVEPAEVEPADGEHDDGDVVVVESTPSVTLPDDDTAGEDYQIGRRLRRFAGAHRARTLDTPDVDDPVVDQGHPDVVDPVVDQGHPDVVDADLKRTVPRHSAHHTLAKPTTSTLVDDIIVPGDLTPPETEAPDPVATPEPTTAAAPDDNDALVADESEIVAAKATSPSTDTSNLDDGNLDDIDTGLTLDDADTSPMPTEPLATIGGFIVPPLRKAAPLVPGTIPRQTTPHNTTTAAKRKLTSRQKALATAVVVALGILAGFLHWQSSRSWSAICLDSRSNIRQPAETCNPGSSYLRTAYLRPDVTAPAVGQPVHDPSGLTFTAPDAPTFNVPDSE